jgi:hypothetical protein
VVCIPPEPQSIAKVRIFRHPYMDHSPALETSNILSTHRPWPSAASVCDNAAIGSESYGWWLLFGGWGFHGMGSENFPFSDLRQNAQTCGNHSLSSLHMRHTWDFFFGETHCRALPRHQAGIRYFARKSVKLLWHPVRDQERTVYGQRAHLQP